MKLSNRWKTSRPHERMQVLGDLGGSRLVHVLLASPVEMRYLTPSIPSFLFLCMAAFLDRASYLPAERWGTYSLYAPLITALSHLLAASHHSVCFCLLSVSPKGSLTHSPARQLVGRVDEGTATESSVETSVGGWMSCSAAGSQRYSATSTCSLSLCLWY